MQRRIVVSILISLTLILSALGFVSYFGVTESVERVLDEHVELATIVANHTEALIQSNLVRLFDISLSGAVRLDDGDWESEKRALERAYEYSIFTDGVFLLDSEGTVILSHPPGRVDKNLLSIPPVSQILRTGESVVSDVYVHQRTGKKGIYVLVPLEDRDGNTVGVAGGEINPTNYILNRILRAVPTKDDTFIELVDSAGTIIASNRASRVFTCTDHDRFLEGLIARRESAVTRCHRCHDDETPAAPSARSDPVKTTDMLAFVPLSTTPWGISVREPESTIFAPAEGLRRKFVFLGIFAMGSMLLLTVGISSRIVKPIRELTAAADRIAAGDLDEPVSTGSGDEIAALSAGLDHMRKRLRESLDSITRHNEELELRVIRRTKQLEQNRRRLSILLDEVIQAQEEERKRIARELHDETSQALAALGMSVDIAKMALVDGTLKDVGIDELRTKVNQILEGLHHLIRDLRPPVLDDLGFESAVKWLLERHLGQRGIRYRLTVPDEFKRAMKAAGAKSGRRRKNELLLFRVIQEGIFNVIKHAEASFVRVHLGARNDNLDLWIEDNGKGYDVHAVMEAMDRGEEMGFGILGMQERILLLDGRLTVGRNPEKGTYIHCRCPLSALEGL